VTRPTSQANPDGSRPEAIGVVPDLHREWISQIRAVDKRGVGDVRPSFHRHVCTTTVERIDERLAHTSRLDVRAVTSIEGCDSVVQGSQQCQATVHRD
jgi:hypothetical protein